MTRARAALLLLLTITSIVPFASPTQAEESAGGRRHGQVLLFLLDRVSFEEATMVPELQALARVGGVGLMTTRVSGNDRRTASYAAVGSGTPNPDERSQGRITRILRSAGVRVCFVGGGPARDSIDRPGIATVAPPGQDVPCDLGTWPLPTPEFPLETFGPADGLLVVDLRAGSWVQTGVQPSGPRLPSYLETVGAVIDGMLTSGPLASRVQVIVAAPLASKRMDLVGDEVTPIVMASGRADRLLQSTGVMHAVRSETTRQTGLVANVDVAPTILDFFGIPIPSEMDGLPIRVTDEPAPFKLHRLHLEQRRIRLPIQVGEVAFVSAAGLVAIVALLIQAGRRSLPAGVARALRFLALCGVALPIPLMLGGLLPRLTYWVVVPFVVLSVVSLAALARSSRWPAPTGPFVFLGLVGMAVVVVDAMFGWRGARIPLIGGTMFDGARFYGLPNAFLCVVLAGALFVVATLPAFTGFLLLVAVGLFAGFPSLGADIGGAMTLFFAAGLWWVLRTRPRFGLKELVFVAGLTALGLGAVLLANRYLPGTPTHATAFVERTGRGLGGAFREFGARLRIGFGQLAKAPAAWIPLVGLPAVLAAVLTRPGPIGVGLAIAGERWRHALIVLALSGIVAFFANDTGLAAAAPVFLYAMSGMAYPAWLAAGESAVNGAAPPSGDNHE